MPIPIIDLFAGPGGLGEGFCSVRTDDGQPAFHLALSIEKELSAHSTLLLRAVQRRLYATAAYGHYVDFVTGNLQQAEFRAIPAVAEAFREAETEARNFELGRTPESTIDREIRRGLAGATDWVLIGGPPCQAYSLAGRSRRANDESFSSDVKHFLYREYLRIIRKFKPAIFVMENVKGLLSSTHGGKPMFGRILGDLCKPFDGTEYEVRSFVQQDRGLGLAPDDYLIEAERFGIPQSRHRVILLGVRNDFSRSEHLLLDPCRSNISVAEAISDLPPIRSRLSRGGDSAEAWHAALTEAVAIGRKHVSSPILNEMRHAAQIARSHRSCGAAFISRSTAKSPAFGPRPASAVRVQWQSEYRQWVARPEIGGVLQHESRSHMAEDLGRYLFAACFAQHNEYSPRLRHFPDVFLPNHQNAAGSDEGNAPFQDRFRVQWSGDPSTTIVSHIAKDGHYYIHFDPSQCRSLTVREAARLQTFPDDYFFMGNRTQQYTQVGNAVPPLLAHKLGAIVLGLMQDLRADSLPKAA
jgi:DNA (cytosine-5)-methyltransferase 1